MDLKDKSLDYLSHLYNNTYYTDNDEFSIFKQFVEKNYNLAYDNGNLSSSSLIHKLENLAKQYKDYIKIHKCLIPEGILPQDKIGYLYDINVHMYAKYRKELQKQNKFFGNGDDHIYKTFPEIQKNIPRGLTICKIKNKKNNDNDDDDDDNDIEFQDICIYANKKFTGISDIDDDDNHDNYEKYFIQDTSTTKNIISMEKMNGDSFHFSYRFLYDKWYLFIGSKNSHIMISEKSDIDLYTDDRYNVSKKFAKSFFTQILNNKSRKDLIALYNLIHFTKITAICEILQPSYQHIVAISNSNNDDDDDDDDSKIIFLHFSPTFNELNSLTAFPPHITIKVMKLLNLTCAPYRIIDNLNHIEKENIRQDTNSEGRVLYYLNENYETIGLVKLKTIWYTCLRALREKVTWYIKTKSNDIWVKIDERYDKIQQQQFNLTHDEVNYWKEIAKNFIEWLTHQSYFRIDAHTIRTNFPIIWKKFMEERE